MGRSGKPGMAIEQAVEMMRKHTPWDELSKRTGKSTLYKALERYMPELVADTDDARNKLRLVEASLAEAEAWRSTLQAEEGRLQRLTAELGDDTGKTKAILQGLEGKVAERQDLVAQILYIDSLGASSREVCAVIEAALRSGPCTALRCLRHWRR